MTTATTSTSFQLFNQPQLPGLTALIDQVENIHAFSSWNEYIDVISSSPDAALLPVGLEPENLEDCKRTWAEQCPINRDDDSLNFLSELVFGERFDLESEELEENFEDLLMYLNTDLSILWNPFVETVLRLNNALPADFVEDDGDLDEDAPVYNFSATPERIQNFCDHILLWAYVHDAPLLNPIFT